ncbi:hypothetical protein EUGRSUZ_L01234 [Eucalyptus grandis]|uniref:Uncharacterized protein n=1 Tax=Eucalyptus grandis TaxID=71139 RepID=A0A058ZTL5_EUCGR|nr:hypothetical protein EUGRSUZ_L01234 [Eucalyptus grandis]
MQRSLTKLLRIATTHEFLHLLFSSRWSFLIQNHAQCQVMISCIWTALYFELQSSPCGVKIDEFGMSRKVFFIGGIQDEDYNCKLSFQCVIWFSLF